MSTSIRTLLSCASVRPFLSSFLTATSSWRGAPEASLPAAWPARDRARGRASTTWPFMPLPSTSSSSSYSPAKVRPAGLNLAPIRRLPSQLKDCPSSHGSWKRSSGRTAALRCREARWASAVRRRRTCLRSRPTSRGLVDCLLLARAVGPPELQASEPSACESPSAWKQPAAQAELEHFCPISGLLFGVGSLEGPGHARL
mmetsp:Transcript_102184/g.264238  ORF Transcript_102184/g.264238 Transcript_102184/m.264238 type:complete len:200 (-) Transcript_102184:42-641(-)